uniref:SnoaL-like domain-containing protein n=1 Tax=Mizugakiibacter sediminis TaxID=1475481 RepID=A0A0S6YYX6_9GAMM
MLDAYARGDKATVMSMVDPHDIHVYGTDISEVAADPAAFERMFEADQKLWGGKAKFGEMSHVSTIRTRNLATLFFDISFSVGSQPPLQVRFATVWRREHGMWKLVQSTNAVPTVGQSASEILAKPHH